MATTEGPSTGVPHRRISVALCTYNSVRFLAQQLESILSQDYPIHEVVIADDGSTDGTLELISHLADTVPGGEKIRVVATERVGGFSKNFERALAACEGDAIALSDHDDVWLPGRLSAAVGLLGDVGSRALTFADAQLIDDDGRVLDRTLFEAYDVSPTERAEVAGGDAFLTLIRRNIVTGATVLFDAALAHQALPVGNRWIHDEWLAITAAAIGRVHMIPEPVIQYRLHGSNQIGVPPRSRLKRTVAALRVGSPRFHLHRDRAAVLMQALERLDAPARWREHAAAKFAFEEERCRYTRIPLLRYGRIRRQWDAGKYAEFVPFPALERWRDLLQRP